MVLFTFLIRFVSEQVPHPGCGLLPENPSSTCGAWDLAIKNLTTAGRAQLMYNTTQRAYSFSETLCRQCHCDGNLAHSQKLVWTH